MADGARELFSGTVHSPVQPTLPNLVLMGVDSGRTAEPPPPFDGRSAVPLRDRMEAWVTRRVTETGRPNPIME